MDPSQPSGPGPFGPCSRGVALPCYAVATAGATDGGSVVVGGEQVAAGTIGRRSELNAIARFLAAVPTGPSALLIEGEAGIGKTTLWKEAVAAAHRDAFQVLSCRPAHAEMALPYMGLGDLFAHVPTPVLAELPAPQRRSLDVALLRADDSGQALHQRTLSVAVSNALPILARAGPVLIAVDDAQWLDPPSRHVLRYALRRISPASIGVLLARRSGAPEEDPLGLGAALPADALQRMTVGPLDLASLGTLLHERLRAPFAAPALRRLGEASRGNPFFALELGRALLDAGDAALPGEPLPVPSSLTELLGARLLRLSRPVRQALLTTASLSRPTVDLVRAACGVAGTADALQRAHDAGLIEMHDGALRFTHPLLASVLHSQATAHELRRLHRRLAALVTGADERARHLALSAVEPDEEVAAAIDGAAVRAARRGAPDAAAALLEQATRLTPPVAVDRVLRRTLDAADQHLAAGDTTRARTLFDQVATVAGDDTTRARALHGLGRIRFFEGRFRAAMAYLEKASQQAGGDVALRFAIERDSVFALMNMGAMPDAVRHARAAVQVAQDSGDRESLVEALYYLCMIAFVHGDELDARLLQRAIALDGHVSFAPLLEHPGLGTGRFPLAIVLKFSDRFDDARALFRALYAEHVEHGDETALPPVLFALGELACWTGDLDEAERLAGEVRAVAARTGQAVVDARAVLLEAMVAVRRGDAETARAAASASLALAEASEDAPALLRSLRSLGLLELSLGNAEAALVHLQRGVELEASAGYDPCLARLLPDAVEALVAVGRLDDALRLTLLLEAGAARHARPWCVAGAARCRGIVDAAAGDFDAALAALQRAVSAHEQLDQPFELARTLLASGRVQRRAKQRGAARHSLDRAVAIFESLGAQRWAELARRELHRIGGRSSTPFALTATERRVAELVAEGQTNREVAATLFMSAKTVETNLTRIFAKLGVGSRRELARLPAEDKPRDSP